ncbi:hypothetical protein [Burkholderia metallica]
MVEILPRMRHLFDGSAIFPAQANALKQSQTNLNVLVVAVAGRHDRQAGRDAGTVGFTIAGPQEGNAERVACDQRFG